MPDTWWLRRASDLDAIPRRLGYHRTWLAEPHVDVDTAANGKWYGMLIRQSFHGRTHLVSDVSGVMDVQVREAE